MNIELRGWSKSFGKRCVIDNISITIPNGEIVALVGVNGAGKTTLLRGLASIVIGDSGEIRYDGEILCRERLELRKRLMFLPDFPLAYGHWTPLQHIGMILKLYGVADPEIEKTVLELFRELDLLPQARVPISTLSRGQNYKVALIPLLAVNPSLWLLDEPFASGMDPNGLTVLKKHATAAAANGRTIVYTTQILDAAARFCTKIGVIHDTALRAFASPAELQQNAAESGNGLEELFQKFREEKLA